MTPLILMVASVFTAAVALRTDCLPLGLLALSGTLLATALALDPYGKDE